MIPLKGHSGPGSGLKFPGITVIGGVEINTDIPAGNCMSWVIFVIVIIRN